MKKLSAFIILLLSFSLFAERENIKEGKKGGDDFRKAGLEYSEKAKQSLADGNIKNAKIYERLAAIKRSAAKLADEGAWDKISWDEYKRLSKELQTNKSARHQGEKKKMHDKGKHEKADHAKRGQVKSDQAGKSGTVVGAVISVAKGKLTVKNGDTSMTLMPHWTGGHPSEGGGFDKAILKQMSQLKAGDIVKIKWEHSEHNRVLAIQKL